MELVCSVHAEPLPMQILALANNAGKANQVCDCQLESSHRYSSMPHHIYDCLLTCHDIAGCSNDLCRIGKPLVPHLDCLAYLSQLVLLQMNVCKLPLLVLIYHNDMSWRSYRMFFRDPSMATSKQTYYDISTMLLKVAATLPDALKSKVCCCHTME